MNKKKEKKNKTVYVDISKDEGSTPEDIKVFWIKEAFWDSLEYNKKLEYYWRYSYKDGVRVFDYE